MSSLTSPQDFARNVVSMSNPLLKGFAEFGLGVSSFQGGPMGGRDIADMDPLLGRIFTQAGLQNELPSQQAAPAFGSRSLEFLLANSPFSAVLSTAKTALDYDRKTGMQRALNLLTGLKFTTVSPEGSRRALREVINADARDVGARAFETFHVSPELIEYVRQNFPERLERILAGKRMIEIWNQEDRVKKRIRRTQEKAGAKS